MQHYILFLQHFKITLIRLQDLAYNGLNVLIYQVRRAGVRKPYKIFKIMIPAAGYQVIQVIQFHLGFYKIKQVFGYGAIINKPNGVSFLPGLYAFRYFVNKALCNIVINVQLGIAGYFNRKGLYMVKPEHGKYFGQVVPDNVIQQYNIALIRV